MSRYTLPPSDPAVTEVVVGYDHPMKTFFVQLYGHDDDTPLLDRGDPLDRLNTPEQALELVAPHAVLPDELADQLRTDACHSIPSGHTAA